MTPAEQYQALFGAPPPRGMSRADISRRVVDETTRRRRVQEDQQAAAQRAAEAEAAARVAEAAARARAAEAEARARELAAQGQEADRQRAEREAAAARRDAAEAAIRARQERARERLYQLGINIAAPVAGIGTGIAVAHVMRTQTAEMIAAQAPQLKSLAAQASKLMTAATRTKAPAQAALAASKLAGVVATTRRMRLTRGGPLGAGMAAILLAEGMFSRFVLAPNVDNPVAREAIASVGTASVFAASSLISHRITQNRLMVPSRNPVHVATLEGARHMVTGGGNILQRMAAGLPWRHAVASGAGVRPVLAASAAAPAAATVPVGGGIRPSGRIAAAITIAVGLAYLSTRAERRALAGPSGGPALSGPGQPAGGPQRMSYVTIDGRTVEGTAGQIAAWSSRRAA